MPKSFLITQRLMGVYLSWHFLALMPYGKDLFSSEGVFPKANLNFSFGYFPDLLYGIDSPLSISLFLGILVLLSIWFFFGLSRRVISFLLWYGWACLYHRNNLIENPSIGIVGWLLLAFALMPSEEKRQKELMMGAWLVMGVFYSASGFHKLQSVGWISGEALQLILQNPMARFSLGLPPILLKFFSWFFLIAELCFLPGIFFKRGRIIFWSLTALMHLGILILLDLSDLTLGVLLLHAFTYETKFWQRKAFSS